MRAAPPPLPPSLAHRRVPGDEKTRAVAASTAAKNKYAWYGQSAMQIAREKGHHAVTELFASPSSADASSDML